MEGYEFEIEVIDRLARLETKLSELTGNGRPGMVEVLERRVRTVEAAQSRQQGAMAIISALGAGIGLVADWLMHRMYR